ncbi:MAG: hypothetical protein U1E87_06125 [Alphaproteobacteria bacterium]
MSIALALAGWFALALPSHADGPEPVAIGAATTGDAAELNFAWPAPVDATAKTVGRTLTVSFTRPFEADLAKVADAVAPFGRFVRLSADRKTLSIGLTRDLAASAERTPAGWSVHLAPGGAPTPTPASDKPASETASDKPHSATLDSKAEAETATKEKPVAAKNAPPANTPLPAEAVAPPPAAAKTSAEPGKDAGPAPDGPATPELTVSEGADYTRLAFQWPKPVEYTAELAEGELTLAFKSKQEVRLADLRVHPPSRVRDAAGTLASDTFIAKIKVDPGVALRHAKDENYVIVDLVGPKDEDHAADATHTEAHSSPSGETGAVPPAVPMLIAASAVSRDAHAAAQAEGDAHGARPPHPRAPPAPNIAPDTIKSVMNLGDIDVSVLEERLKEGSHADESANADSAEAPGDDAHDGEARGAADAAAVTAEPEPLSVAVAPSSAFAMTVALDSRVIKLGFPWGEAVPAAVLRRGDRLWIAFAREAEIDLSGVERVRAEGVLGATLVPMKGGTIVGLKLADNLLATLFPSPAAGRSRSATRSHADRRHPARAPARRKGGDGRRQDRRRDRQVRVSGPRGEGCPRIRDGGGPRARLVSARRFVDFDLLATTQGLVVRPLADDIDVRLEPDTAIIARRGGLHIAGTHLVSASRANSMLDPAVSPAEMKFAEWRGPAKVPFTDAYQGALMRLAKSEDADRTDAEIDLARFLMGYGLNEEAIGVLNVAVGEAPQLVNQPQFRALRGVANLLAGRPKVAKQDLDLEELPDDASTAMWLGLLASAEQDFPRARSYLARAEPAIVRLDNEWQAKVRLKAAEAGLAINDFGWARSAIELMPTENLSRGETDEAKLLRARLAEAMGDPKAAAVAYDALAHSPIEPVAVKAELAAALQDVRAGKLSTNDAIDRLESLRFEWRGDAIEAQTLLALGQLYAKLGDYRHALSTMRIVVRQFPGTPDERRVYSEMADLFEDLFLAGKADRMPPIQALALYFDFKELTPIGPKGDVMIRRLSDRLVAMDLLDQAGDLLKHQVDNRLSGVARSQVAARLALVQLMNHKPEDALLTINKTRQARLPDDISLQRRLIEARALMDLKRYEHALDVVSGDGGPTVDRLRADIYWHAEDWAKAGPALEAGLGQAAEAQASLSEAQRFDAMRAAIAFALGNDRTGLSRVKGAYAARMRDTPDAHGFDVVTSEPGQGSVELYSLAERFAGIDTLADFLGQLKEKDVVEKVN